MKIDFTKKEYRLLIDMIYLANWMLGAFDNEPDPKKGEYEMIAQKIYSFAKEMDCESLIEVSKEVNAYYPTREFEKDSGIHEHIDKYNSDIFWEELIHRLTDRDVDKKAKELNRKIESREEYWELGAPFAEKYANEFEENGLNRLEIRET